MKVLFFIESLGSGGKERRMVELIRGLSLDPSYEIDLVLIKKELHYKEALPAKVNIFFTERKGLKKDPRIFYQFFQIARKLKPDVIHVWGNLAAIYAIPAKKLLGIPMINNQIANASIQVGNSILNHKISFPFSNKIIGNSYAGLKAYNAPTGKSSVIYNGFDFKRLDNLNNIKDVRNEFNVSSELVIGMVATFSNAKDYKTYIEAANIVLSEFKNVTFLCIGNGDDTNYKEMVAPQNRENVLFLGKQSNVENIMNICDIGVLATYTEGISNALLEFSALAKPVVTNFGGGNIELVEQGKTGFLVNQSSPKELAEKIIMLLRDETKRKQMGSAGKQRIKNEFSISKMISSFDKAYKEVTKNE